MSWNQGGKICSNNSNPRKEKSVLGFLLHGRHTGNCSPGEGFMVCRVGNTQCPIQDGF